MNSQKNSVIPAKAGIHLDLACSSQEQMDSRFRGNDGLIVFLVRNGV